MVTEQGFDLVSGWKQKRYDNAFTKNLPSKLYNWTNRKISGIKLHDMNCGLKAYKKKVVKSIEVYVLSAIKNISHMDDRLDVVLQQI